jgi:hypothetical protein
VWYYVPIKLGVTAANDLAAAAAATAAAAAAAPQKAK